MPCLSAACACGMLRARAASSPIVCSAAEVTVDSGAFATTIPRLRCGGDVDVVDPHARAADHLQPLGAVDQVAGQLRRGADHDRVVVADALGEIAVRVHVDVEALAEEVDPRLGDRLPDEDARATHTGVCSKASSARVTATPRSTSAPSSTSASSTAASAVVMSNTS